LNQPRNSAGTAAPGTSPDDRTTHEPDEEFHLGKATEEELKRLATHPVQEVERLADEIEEGEKGSSMLLLVSGIAASVWFLAALLMVAVFLVAYLAAG
jgi:hypothetical protein